MIIRFAQNSEGNITIQKHKRYSRNTIFVWDFVFCLGEFVGKQGSILEETGSLFYERTIR